MVFLNLISLSGPWGSYSMIPAVASKSAFSEGTEKSPSVGRENIEMEISWARRAS